MVVQGDNAFKDYLPKDILEAFENITFYYDPKLEPPSFWWDTDDNRYNETILYDDYYYYRDYYYRYDEYNEYHYDGDDYYRYDDYYYRDDYYLYNN